MAAAKKPAKKTAAKKPAPVKTPQVPSQAQAAKSASKAGGPPPRRAATKNTTTNPKRPTKPRARGDKTKAGPLGPRNGTGSIPYQGSGPTAGGSMGYSGFGG